MPPRISFPLAGLKISLLQRAALVYPVPPKLGIPIPKAVANASGFCPGTSALDQAFLPRNGVVT
jgi:hypothetical protein